MNFYYNYYYVLHYSQFYQAHAKLSPFFYAQICARNNLKNKSSLIIHHQLISFPLFTVKLCLLLPTVLTISKFVQAEMQISDSVCY